MGAPENITTLLTPRKIPEKFFLETPQLRPYHRENPWGTPSPKVPPNPEPGAKKGEKIPDPILFLPGKFSAGENSEKGMAPRDENSLIPNPAKFIR